MDSYNKWNLSLSYFSVTRCKSSNRLHSIIIKAFKSIVIALELFFSFFEICRADYVYVPAMILGWKKERTKFLFARLIRKKIICEFYISFFDTYVLDRKTVDKNSSQANKWFQIDQKMHQCYRVIYLNNVEANRYTSVNRLNLSELNYTIIPLTIKERQEVKLSYWKQRGKIFNIVWWGTYIPLHGLDKLITAVAEIVKEMSDVHFYIIGNLEERSLPFVKTVESMQLCDYITIRNDYSFSNGLLEPFLVENCDLAMGAFGDSEKAKNVILNKCIEATAMKIPVLTQHSAAFKEFFLEGKSVFYSENSVRSIKNKIIEIKKMPVSDIMDHVNNAHYIYKYNFSPERSIELYSQLLDSL